MCTLLHFNFQRLIVPQPVKKFHKFYGNQKLILGPQEYTTWNCCLTGQWNSATVNTHNTHRTNTSTTQAIYAQSNTVCVCVVVVVELHVTGNNYTYQFLKQITFQLIFKLSTHYI
jgi:hypothetical protein